MDKTLNTLNINGLFWSVVSQTARNRQSSGENPSVMWRSCQSNGDECQSDGDAVRQSDGERKSADVSQTAKVHSPPY